MSLKIFNYESDWYVIARGKVVFHHYENFPKGKLPYEVSRFLESFEWEQT